MKYTVGMVAKQLGVSRQRVDQIIRAGRIRSDIDIATGWRLVSDSELTRYKALARLSGRPTKPKPVVQEQVSRGTMAEMIEAIFRK